MEQQKGRIVSDRLREEALDLAFFEQAKSYAFDYMEHVCDRSVYPEQAAIDGLEIFKESLQPEPEDPYEILGRLHRYGSPATSAQTGGRFFGFVTGGDRPGRAWGKMAVR